MVVTERQSIYDSQYTLTVSELLGYAERFGRGLALEFAQLKKRQEEAQDQLSTVAQPSVALKFFNQEKNRDQQYVPCKFETGFACLLGLLVSCVFVFGLISSKPFAQ